MASRVAGLVLLCVALLAWLVFMGGVARATDLCNKAQGTSPADCASITGLDWWGVFLAIICIMLEALTTFKSDRFSGIRGTKVAFFIMLQALLFQLANEYCQEAYGLGGKGSAFHAAAAAAAGSVLLLMVNFILIIIETSDYPSASPYPVAKSASPAVTGTTTAV